MKQNIFHFFIDMLILIIMLILSSNFRLQARKSFYRTYRIRHDLQMILYTYAVLGGPQAGGDMSRAFSGSKMRTWSIQLLTTPSLVLSLKVHSKTPWPKNVDSAGLLTGNTTSFVSDAVLH